MCLNQGFECRLYLSGLFSARAITYLKKGPRYEFLAALSLSHRHTNSMNDFAVLPRWIPQPVSAQLRIMSRCEITPFISSTRHRPPLAIGLMIDDWNPCTWSHDAIMYQRAVVRINTGCMKYPRRVKGKAGSDAEQLTCWWSKPHLDIIYMSTRPLSADQHSILVIICYTDTTTMYVLDNFS